ncbi:MAG TPA: tetratricopeptide repeat protein [Myxococcaceae bacterium]|nr:tetratricopeptide repeat protein [Myxococcaceae bacterium]
MVTFERVALVGAAAALAAGCSTPFSPRLMTVPPEMSRSVPAPVTSRPVPGAPQKMELRGPSSDTKYVVRLAEGGRVWEVELPESAGGYEVRVPLAGGPLEQMTSADEELLADSTAKAATSGLPEAGGGKAVDAKGAAKKKSYLGSLAKVNELYVGKKFELALIEVVALEKEYPQDSRILSMKGSLYLKLGKHKLAREAWEKALQINPNDQALAEALRELSSREE